MPDKQFENRSDLTSASAADDASDNTLTENVGPFESEEAGEAEGAFYGWAPMEGRFKTYRHDHR